MAIRFHNGFDLPFLNQVLIYLILFLFSSPEPNAQVSFSDHNLSVVRCRCCCRLGHRCSCCKLFTFSSSSPEPLYQPNLEKSLFGWWEFKSIQMKDQAHSKGRWLRNSENTLTKYQKSSPETLGLFPPNLAQSILGWWGFTFVQMKGHAFFQGEIISKEQKYIDKILISSSPEPLS